MKLTLDLKLKKFITLAEIKGSADVKTIAEFATRGAVKQQLINSLKQSGLTGTVVFDGEEISL